MLYFALKFLHLIGATVLLGTGAGIAFFMLMAHRTGEAVQVAAVARIVVVADFLFTASAVLWPPDTRCFVITRQLLQPDQIISTTYRYQIGNLQAAAVIVSIW